MRLKHEEIKNKIIVAIDTSNIFDALRLVRQLYKYVGLFKIGSELINSMVVSIASPKNDNKAFKEIKKIRQLFGLLNGKVFWDGKLADIPSTTGKCILSLSKMKARMLTVHVSAGEESLKQAVKNKDKTLVLGVTVLTSIKDSECNYIFGGRPGKKILQFARMLIQAKADGIVCSPREIHALKKYPQFKKLIKVAPGIRPTWFSCDDQKRTMTPVEAIKAGADYLVIGRPVTNPPKHIGTPREAIELIIREIASV